MKSHPSGIPKRYKLTPGGAAMLRAKQEAQRQAVNTALVGALEQFELRFGRRIDHNILRQPVNPSELVGIWREHIRPALNLARRP